ncbi:MAG: hydantoinase B/oxoprolinase family protein [Thermodesulfobacteriota bacterium]
MHPQPETLLQWIRPEPMSPQQEQGLATLNPGDYEMYNERLNNYLLEAREIFTRMGITSMLRSGDLIVGVYTADGDLVTGSMGLWVHAVTSQLQLKYVIKTWQDNPTVGVKDGDVFYANDALYGGVHNQDQVAMMPVFNEGELIAWICAAVHQSETGAVDPGSFVPAAKSKCEEGMRLSPIKIGENFQIRADLMEMMENLIVRTPRMQNIDVRARFTACDRLRRRVQELARERGNLFVQGLLRRLMIEAESAARKKISGWNDGVYRAVCFIDTTGKDVSLLRFYCTLTKQGDRLSFDFAGTSPEHDGGSVHGTPHLLFGCLAIYLFSYAFHDIPGSTAALAPMDVSVPKGSFCNPAPMASVAMGHIPPLGIFSVSYNLFGKMMFDSPERNLITASNAGCCGAVLAGVNQWGVPVADISAYPFNADGQGARHDMDGVDGYGFVYANIGRGPDAEDWESEFPVLHLFQKHRKDSCGFGKYRGGSGVVTCQAIYGVPWFTEQAILPHNRINVSLSLFGGYPPPPHPWIRVRASDLWEKMARGDKDIPTELEDLVNQRTIKGDYSIVDYTHAVTMVHDGDIFVDSSLGGPGYGDVLERDPNLVMEDLRKEIISSKTAREIFFVAYDPATLKVDQERTEELRQQERAARISRSRPYEEFIRDWNELRPPDEALIHYGSWPDAGKVRDIIRL